VRNGSLTIPPDLEQVARDAVDWDTDLELPLWRAAATSAERVWGNAATIAEAYRAIGRVYVRHDEPDNASRWFTLGWETRPPEGFLRGMQAYALLPNRKAMAMALDTKGSWTFGFFTGEKSDDEATAIALDACRKWLDRYNVDADCELYAVNQEIVWERAAAR
jgi:hypothetical protein